jgi:hypothetical protein
MSLLDDAIGDAQLAESRLLGLREAFKSTAGDVARKDELLAWVANTVHQGYHHEAPNGGVEWRQCSKVVCSAIARELATEGGG